MSVDTSNATATSGVDSSRAQIAGAIKQANEGCDFDFLETGFGAPVGEPSIY